MDKISPLTAKPDLREVQKQFERWRRTRPKRATIPDTLWEKAVGLCQTHPVNKIARSLRLNHANLKNRVQQEACVMLPADALPQFIEIGQVSAGTPGCVVEMENTDGCRMKMYFNSKADLDLMKLATAFWSVGK